MRLADLDDVAHGKSHLKDAVLGDIREDDIAGITAFLASRHATRHRPKGDCSMSGFGGRSIRRPIAA
jgi:hypothetical protein